MAAFAGLGSLANFYLDQVGGIDRFCRDAETPGSDLNPAIEWIFTEQIRDLASFTIQGQHVQAECGFCICPVGDLPL